MILHQGIDPEREFPTPDQVVPQDNTPAHDFEMMLAHLRFIQQDATADTPFDWLAYNDAADEKGQLLPKGCKQMRRASLREMMPDIRRFNTRAHRVAIGVIANDTGGTGFKKTDIKGIRAFTADFDHGTGTRMVADLNASALPPQMVVRTRPGNAHVYWRVDRDRFPVEGYERLAKAFSNKYGSDDAVSNANRVLRVGGSFNFKDDEPFFVTNEIPNASPAHSFDELAKALELGSYLDQLSSGSKRSTTGIADKGVILPPRPPLVGSDDDALGTGISKRWTQERAERTVRLATTGHRHTTLASVAYTAGLFIARGLWDETEMRERFKLAGEAIGMDESEVVLTLNDQFAAASKQIETEQAAIAASAAPFINGVPQWERSARGLIKASYTNAVLALGALSISVERDVFADTIHLNNESGCATLDSDQVGPVSDAVVADLRWKIRRKLLFDPGLDHLHQAIATVGEAHRYNPVTRWLDGLTYNGDEALDTWLPRCTGADDTKLNRAIGRNWIIGAVARARYPGSKYDPCLVLEGVQGVAKTGIGETIAAGPGEGYFGNTPGLFAQGARERAEMIGGKWVVEVPEMAGYAKSDVENAKAILSATHERCRMAYGRIASDRLRTCVFFATTNDSAYLTDPTGNRRFMPVLCRKTDLRLLAKLRSDIFAAADEYVRRVVAVARAKGFVIADGKPLPRSLYPLFALPEKFWAEAAVAVEGRRAIDPLEEDLEAALSAIKPTVKASGSQFISASDLISRIRNMNNGRNPDTRRMANFLTARGWTPDFDGPKNARKRGYSHD